MFDLDAPKLDQTVSVTKVAHNLPAEKLRKMLKAKEVAQLKNEEPKRTYPVRLRVN